MNSAHLIKLYMVYFLLTAVGLVASILALQAFFNIEVGGSLGVVTLILPAMLVGQRYSKRWLARPANGYAWRLTGIFAAISYGIGMLVAVVVLNIAGAWSRFAELFTAEDGAFLVGICVALFFMGWVLVRFFFGFGAKMQMRSMAEQAARAQERGNQP